MGHLSLAWTASCQSNTRWALGRRTFLQRPVDRNGNFDVDACRWARHARTQRFAMAERASERGRWFRRCWWMPQQYQYNHTCMGNSFNARIHFCSTGRSLAKVTGRRTFQWISSQGNRKSLWCRPNLLRADTDTLCSGGEIQVGEDSRTAFWNCLTTSLMV